MAVQPRWNIREAPHAEITRDRRRNGLDGIKRAKLGYIANSVTSNETIPRLTPPKLLSRESVGFTSAIRACGERFILAGDENRACGRGDSEEPRRIRPQKTRSAISPHSNAAPIMSEKVLMLAVSGKQRGQSTGSAPGGTYGLLHQIPP